MRLASRFPRKPTPTACSAPTHHAAPDRTRPQARSRSRSPSVHFGSSIPPSLPPELHIRRLDDAQHQDPSERETPTTTFRRFDHDLEAANRPTTTSTSFSATRPAPTPPRHIGPPPAEPPGNHRGPAPDDGDRASGRSRTGQASSRTRMREHSSQRATCSGPLALIAATSDGLSSRRQPSQRRPLSTAAPRPPSWLRRRS